MLPYFWVPGDRENNLTNTQLGHVSFIASVFANVHIQQTQSNITIHLKNVNNIFHIVLIVTGLSTNSSVNPSLAILDTPSKDAEYKEQKSLHREEARVVRWAKHR